MNPTPAEWSALATLRALVVSGVERAYAIDGYGKSYDGRLVVVMPGASETVWRVTLDCYVLGPSRSYDWTGATLGEVVECAAVDVAGWIAELEEA
jgi:hypothetical protein